MKGTALSIVFVSVCPSTYIYIIIIIWSFGMMGLIAIFWKKNALYIYLSILLSIYLYLSVYLSIYKIYLGIIIWNFGMTGLFAIYWKAPLFLQQEKWISPSALSYLLLIRIRTLRNFNIVELSIFLVLHKMKHEKKIKKEKNRWSHPLLRWRAGLLER